MLNKKFLLFLIFLVSFVLFAFFHFDVSKKIEMKILRMGNSTPDTRKPQEVNIAGKTLVKYPQDYTIVLLGDSMTEKLGNSDELRMFLKQHYPQKTFEVLNYGFGSTNILSVQNRLENDTFYGRVFRPILGIAFDLILIESFGNNPLSEFPLDIGLQKQNEALDKIVATIKNTNPTAKIVFVTTISPNKKRYAEGMVNLSPEQRQKWADERIAYIKNHIEYARLHQIPVINIFEKSLTEEGDGNLDYISTTDFIHPSPTGVIFISQEIADFIFNNHFVPL